MPSKFPSARAEQLYKEAPDDQVGSSTEGLAWAGLYVRQGGAPGGVILVEQTDGFIDEYEYVSEEEMRASWAEFEKSLDIGLPEPGDLVIYDFSGSEAEGIPWEGEVLVAFPVPQSFLEWLDETEDDFGIVFTPRPTHWTTRHSTYSSAVYEVVSWGWDGRIFVWRNGEYRNTDLAS